LDRTYIFIGLSIVMDVYNLKQTYISSFGQPQHG